MVKMSKTSSNLGWKVQLHFAIGLHVKDVVVLRGMREFFENVATLSISNDKVVTYSVRSLNDIFNYILPHFDSYPLITQKRADYLLFKYAALLLKKGSHLSLEGLEKIVNIRASMNRGLTSNLKKAFPNCNPVVRPDLSPVGSKLTGQQELSPY